MCTLLIIIFFLMPESVVLGEKLVVPKNLFSIGDSIGVGEAADNDVGSANYGNVWSTGYSSRDLVYSFNERFEDVCSTDFEESLSFSRHYFNHARSGAKMLDFAGQASDVLREASITGAKHAGMITILLGGNDVCAGSISSMTSPQDFEYYYRRGLDILASASETRFSIIQVSSLPAIYWLWESLSQNDWCNIAWLFVPCENLLDNPGNDCGVENSSKFPDTIRHDDGPNCVRRKTIHALIRDIYNPILENVLNEYIETGKLPNAYYADIFSVRFEAQHINLGDCFHPSVEGQAFLAMQEWRKSLYSGAQLVCNEHADELSFPWLHILLHGED